MSRPISFADVEAAAARLRGVAHRTPVMTSRTADEATGACIMEFQRRIFSPLKTDVAV